MVDFTRLKDISLIPPATLRQGGTE